MQWAFWPPDTDLSTVESESSENGIWIPSGHVAHGDEDAEYGSVEEDDNEDEDDTSISDPKSDLEGGWDSDKEAWSPALKTGGMFAALKLVEGDEDEESDVSESE